MSETWQTIGLSFATSLIVSLITFILGLKSGKNQADRAKLQDLYKNLYSHFSDLKDGLYKNRPKSWKNYKKVERGIYSVEYFPPVKELHRTGDILFIKKGIAKKALELETEVLQYSYELTKHIPQIHAAIVSDLDKYREGYSFKSYQRSESGTNNFETANPKGCNSFFPRNYRDFYNREDITKLFKEMQERKDVAIEFMTGENPITFSAKFYPDGINIDVDEFLEHLYSLLETNVDGFKDLCTKRQTLIRKIEKLNKKLVRKAKEPVGFWETVFGSFTDMFH